MMKSNKSDNKLTLRIANINDLATLNAWDQKEHVIESDPNDDWNWETELLRTPSWRQMYIAEVDGKSIGFLQIIDAYEEETHYWAPVEMGMMAIDIWIGEEAELGKGFGTQMMNLAIEKCFENSSIKGILIDPLKSNTKAHRFYERLGFQVVEERTFGEDECLVYLLKKENWKKATTSTK